MTDFGMKTLNNSMLVMYAFMLNILSHMHMNDSAGAERHENPFYFML